MKLILPSSELLGLHSGLIHIDNKGTLTGFEWTHKTRRPFGVAPRFQCPKCKALKTYDGMSKPSDKGVITWVCTAKLPSGGACKGVQLFFQKKNTHWMHTLDPGRWQVRELGASGEISGFFN
jgi:hypothetical protein